MEDLKKCKKKFLNLLNSLKKEAVTYVCMSSYKNYTTTHCITVKDKKDKIIGVIFFDDPQIAITCDQGTYYLGTNEELEDINTEVNDFLFTLKEVEIRKGFGSR